ncbi:MAG: endonuclease/exonuclease/phosphatase family protein [Cyclobacteriaceae bacterium]|nr:endonuclease/exonuclease/phosphatase family protein [Cyclobacteriaceae bacterium]
MNIRKHVWQAAGLTISAGIYASVWVDPLQYPPAALITHCIPVLWFVQLIWLGITAIRNAGFILYPFLAIVMGLPFLPLTYASTAAKPVKEDCRSVDLLSYNVRLFRERDNYGRFSPATKRWMETVSADIICLQEFSYNPRWQATDLKKLMHDRGYWGVVYAFKSGRSLHNPGLAVFSRFPIVNHGLWMPDTLGLNNGMYADIALNGDTLRCYNVHLRSPQLGTHLKRKDILGLLSGIYKAAVTRRHQTEALLKHAAQSPYPVLLCGDFNEMPYSYNYFRLRSIYKNAFEQAGNGFGFTLNQWPYYLRIDHIFTSDQFKICHFQVLRSTDLSDHFPIAICICPELSNSHNNF